jgi:hypothetical protein
VVGAVIITVAALVVRSIRYLAVVLDITIVEGHGGPRTCGDRTRDAAAVRRRLDPVGLHLTRTGPQWPSCHP